jgi:uncharacterized damage-inducible protein DinB
MHRGLEASSQALALAERLEAAAEELIAVVELIDPESWARIPEPGVWSPGKDAEHVADAAVYHRWIVRMTVRDRVPERPALERKALSAQQSQPAVVDLLRDRTAENARLLRALTDEQLRLPPRPRRPRMRTLAEVIDGVMIGHYRAHRDAIERKLGQKSVGTPPSDLRRSTNANSSSRRASSSGGGS